MWITYDQLQRILKAKSLRLNFETQLRLEQEDFKEEKSEIEYIYYKETKDGGSILRHGVITGKRNNVILVRWDDEWNHKLGTEDEIWQWDLIRRGWFVDIQEEYFEKSLLKNRYR